MENLHKHPQLQLLPIEPYETYNSLYIARGLLAARDGDDHTIVESLIKNIGDVDVTIHASLSFMCSDAIIRVLDVKTHIKASEDIWDQVDDECVYKWGIVPVTLLACFDHDYRLHLHVCDNYMIDDIILFYTHVIFGNAIGAVYNDAGFIKYNHGRLSTLVDERLSILTDLSNDNKTMSVLRNLAIRHDRSHRATCLSGEYCGVCTTPLLDIVIRHEIQRSSALQDF